MVVAWTSPTDRGKDSIPGLSILTTFCDQQQMRLKEAIEKNQQDVVNGKGVVIYHDNAKPHSSKATQQK